MTRRLWLLFAGLLVLHCLGTWILPIVDRDEPRFAEASREMLERRDFVVPYFNDRERFDKPPLIYWLQAASYSVFGESEFAARFPAALSAALTSLAIALWGRRLFDETTGIRAGLIFGLSLQLFVHAKAAVADMPMVLGVTVAAWAGWEWLRGTNHRGLAAAVFWISLAVGFLAKGPIALVPIGMVAAAARWPDSSRPRWYGWLGGAFLMLAIIGAWGVPALLRTEGAFAEIGLGRHVVARSFSPMEGHGAQGLIGYLATLPFYFFTIFGSLFPWSIWLIPAAKHYRSSSNRDDLGRYLLIGCAIVFAVFTLSRTKLPHYTMPAFPFIALLLSAWWAQHRRARTAWRVAGATAVVFAIAALALFPFAAAHFPSEQLHRESHSFIGESAPFGAVGYQEPSLVWTFRKTTSGFMTELKPEQAQEFLSQPGPRFLIIRERDIVTSLPRIDPKWRVFRTEGFQIAKGRPVTLFVIVKSGQVSSTKVTGPSFTSSTSIISRKAPVST